MPKKRTGFARLKRRARMYLDFQYRMLTSQKRVTPDFVVIGGQKCGTTSLYHYIKMHPNFTPPYKKGGTYFDANYSRGPAWYRAHFPMADLMAEKRDAGINALTGEVATSYIHHPLAASRMAGLQPSVKLIAVLRNPVERAYSHYQHMVRTGREDLDFKSALEMEDERVEQSVKRAMANDPEALRKFRDFSYKSRGRYAEQLKRWFGAFDREQFLILNSEDLFERPMWVCNQIYHFLGIPDQIQMHYENANPGRYSPADAGILRELAEYFKPYNQALYDLIGQDFGWDAREY